MPNTENGAFSLADNKRVKMKIITISAKCSDLFCMSSDTGLEYDGYVPYSAVGGGDYVEMCIDNATGQILNWRPFTAADFGIKEEETEK
jgi:hypothetical protein